MYKDYFPTPYDMFPDPPLDMFASSRGTGTSVASTAQYCFKQTRSEAHIDGKRKKKNACAVRVGVSLDKMRLVSVDAIADSLIFIVGPQCYFYNRGNRFPR